MYYGADHNRRFPYRFRIERNVKDEHGMPVFDDDGNPVKENMPIEMCVMNSQGYPVRNVEGAFVTETVTDVPWGYRTSTGGIKDSGEVFKTDFKIACPKLMTDLPQGSVLILTDDTHTWHSTVQKCTSYQWGTNIWFDNPGNNEQEIPAEE